MEKVYFDNSATTKISPLAKKKMLERGLMAPQNGESEKGTEMYF